jgi:hypothetical protein
MKFVLGTFYLRRIGIKVSRYMVNYHTANRRIHALKGGGEVLTKHYESVENSTLK